MKKTSSYAVPALEKGLDVLEILSASREAHSLTTLAQKLHRSPSELFRMLNCLESRGYIRREPESGCYRLTLKLYELAHGWSPERQLLDAAAKPMRELTEEVGESCHLSVLSRGCQLVLAQESSPKPIRLSIEAGARFPAVETASGRLLLAFLPAEEWRGFQAGDDAWRGLKPVRKRQVKAQIEKIAAAGFCSARSEVAQGIHDLAVPVGGMAPGLNAALAVPLLIPPRDERSIRDIVRAMQRAAARITESLGLRPL